MYFIRMMLLWLVLIARCSGSDEIPLDRAEQSSKRGIGSGTIATLAIDNDIVTHTYTSQEDPAESLLHQQLYSGESGDRGHRWDIACLWTVSVYDEEVEPVCGTYTGKPFG